ncbi:MAG: hypothetical protein WCV90_00790 [Candidatus Woesearchaeota archaeon]
MIQNYLRKAAAYLTIIGTVLSYAPRIGEGQVTWTPPIQVITPPPQTQTLPSVIPFYVPEEIFVQSTPTYDTTASYFVDTGAAPTPTARRLGHRSPQYLGTITREPENPASVIGLENIILSNERSKQNLVNRLRKAHIPPIYLPSARPQEEQPDFNINRFLESLEPLIKK